MDTTVTVCRHCGTRKPYDSGNTSSMATHLKRHHPGVSLTGVKTKAAQQPLITAAFTKLCLFVLSFFFFFWMNSTSIYSTVKTLLSLLLICILSSQQAVRETQKRFVSWQPSCLWYFGTSYITTFACSSSLDNDYFKNTQNEWTCSIKCIDYGLKNVKLSPKGIYFFLINHLQISLGWTVNCISV